MTQVSDHQARETLSQTEGGGCRCSIRRKVLRRPHRLLERIEHTLALTIRRECVSIPWPHLGDVWRGPVLDRPHGAAQVDDLEGCQADEGHGGTSQSRHTGGRGAASLSCGCGSSPLRSSTCPSPGPTSWGCKTHHGRITTDTKSFIRAVPSQRGKVRACPFQPRFGYLSLPLPFPSSCLPLFFAPPRFVGHG